jgi:hypothetical protein
MQRQSVDRVFYLPGPTDIYTTRVGSTGSVPGVGTSWRLKILLLRLGMLAPSLLRTTNDLVQFYQ